MARGKGVTSNPAFQIRWRDVLSVARDLTTGMTEAEAAEAARAERPMVVFVYDPDSEDADDTDKAFQEERVAVGARFFDCLRISKLDAAEDRLLASYAEKAPVLVFVRPTFEVAASQTARFNANKIFAAMCTTMKKDYKNCVDTVLKKQREIQKERASLERDKEKLAKLDEQAGNSESRRAKADKLRAEIADAEAALDEKESSLYQLEPKESAPTS